MTLSRIPGRIFLDTCTVNFALDHGEHIFDGVPLPNDASRWVMADVEALHAMLLTGRRAFWQLAVSPHTYVEVQRTSDPVRRRYIESWFMELWHYWLRIMETADDLPSFIEAEQLKIGIMGRGPLDVLPDIEDRILLIDALVYNADCFCTRDWETILKQRDHLTDFPLPIISPSEWWDVVKPYSGLW